MKTQRCRGFQGEITPSAAKGTRLDFTRSLRMASVAAPPGPLLATVRNVCYTAKNRRFRARLEGERRIGILYIETESERL